MKYIEWVPPAENKVKKSESIIILIVKNIIIWILTHIIPKANPDIEKEHELVKKWWLEINENGLAEREIGFNEKEKPFVLGPIGRNYGMVTDSPLIFSEEQNIKEIEQNFNLI